MSRRRRRGGQVDRNNAWLAIELIEDEALIGATLPGRWFGPSDLPKTIVDKLYPALKEHYIGKAGQAAIVNEGLEPGDEGLQEFTARLKGEIARWIQIGAELGVPKSKL
jgi:hypothetical protein